MRGCTQRTDRRASGARPTATAHSLWLAVALCACSNDPKALYADAPALPLLPFLPDEDRIDDCEACAREQCNAERDACIADPDCADLLDCRGKCNNPACLAG
jgi:hypothetical protein